MGNEGLEGERAHLEEVLQAALETGVLVQMNGGDTARVSESIRTVALALGAQSVQPAVSAVNVAVTVQRGAWSRTAFRQAGHVGIDFGLLTELSRLTDRVQGMGVGQFRAELDHVVGRARRYPVPLIMAALGLSCGSFAALFGSDWFGILAATAAGALGATVRHLLVRRGFMPFVFCIAAAFASVSTVLLLQGPTETLDPALAACILYLIPGVPLLNGTSDLLSGHYLNGLVRLTMSTVVVGASTIGMVLALEVWEPVG